MTLGIATPGAMALLSTPFCTRCLFRVAVGQQVETRLLAMRVIERQHERSSIPF